MNIACNTCNIAIAQRASAIAIVLEAKKQHELQSGHYPNATQDGAGP